MKTGQKLSFVFVAAMLLCSCTPRAHEEPTVVLARAALAARELRSATFDGSFSYRSSEPKISLSGTTTGVMADGGRHLSFNISGDLTMPTDGPDQTVSVDADVIVADENETYLRIDRMEGSVLMLPSVGLIPADMQHTWYSMITESGSSSITPDPSLLELQADALVVQSDRSFQDVRGHDCYVYDVTLDPAKLLSFFERTAQGRGQPFNREEAQKFIDSFDARGTVWIDADSSVVRSISWQLVNTAGNPEMSASFSVTLDKHNENVEISPPAQAVPLTDAMANTQLPLF